METLTVLRVDTGEAVRSVNDLRDNIKLLKSRVSELEIGTQEYQDTLSELKVNQNALKDAMYATSSSMEDLAQSATGAAESYNSLVHRMAAMKEELRATDVSTERGKARFRELAEQVNEVNGRLKEMDALQGNYQRNVGNYTSALNGLGDILKELPPTLGRTKEELGKVGQTLGLIGKQPVLATIGLLAPAIMKITESLKDNETVLAAIDKAMAALQPLIDLAGAALQKVADIVAKVIEYFTSLAGESGETFKRIIAGAVGVGNAVLQFLLTPIRTTIEAVKGLGDAAKNLFTGKFREAAKSAGEAAKGVGESLRKGFSLADNFKAGQEAGERFVAGLGSTKAKAKAAGEGVGKAAEEGMKLAKVTDQMINATDATIAKRIEAQKAAAEEMKSINAAIEEDTSDTLDFVNEVLGEIDRQQAQAVADMAERAKQKRQLIKGAADATSSILSSVADMYESNGAISEEQAEQVKAMRIASATIDTISGAVAAYTGTVEVVKGPAGVILGAVQAAAVTAAGLAQIAKIKATDVSGKTTASVSSSGISATQAAPATTASLGQVRTVTTASEEERLNAAAAPSRVYILASDLQAERNATRTRIAETTF